MNERNEVRVGALTCQECLHCGSRRGALIFCQRHLECVGPDAAPECGNFQPAGSAVGLMGGDPIGGCRVAAVVAVAMLIFAGVILLWGLWPR